MATCGWNQWTLRSNTFISMPSLLELHWFCQTWFSHLKLCGWCWLNWWINRLLEQWIGGMLEFWFGEQISSWTPIHLIHLLESLVSIREASSCFNSLWNNCARFLQCYCKNPGAGRTVSLLEWVESWLFTTDQSNLVFAVSQFWHPSMSVWLLIFDSTFWFSKNPLEPMPSISPSSSPSAKLTSSQSTPRMTTQTTSALQSSAASTSILQSIPTMDEKLQFPELNFQFDQPSLVRGASEFNPYGMIQYWVLDSCMLYQIHFFPPTFSHHSLPFCFDDVVCSLLLMYHLSPDISRALEDQSALLASLDESRVQSVLWMITPHGFPAFSSKIDLLGFYQLTGEHFEFRSLESFEGRLDERTKDLKTHYLEFQKTQPNYILTKENYVTLEKLKENLVFMYLQTRADQESSNAQWFGVLCVCVCVCCVLILSIWLHLGCIGCFGGALWCYHCYCFCFCIVVFWNGVWWWSNEQTNVFFSKTQNNSHSTMERESFNCRLVFGIVLNWATTLTFHRSIIHGWWKLVPLSIRVIVLWN